MEIAVALSVAPLMSKEILWILSFVFNKIRPVTCTKVNMSIHFSSRFHLEHLLPCMLEAIMAETTVAFRIRWRFGLIDLDYCAGTFATT